MKNILLDYEIEKPSGEIRKGGINITFGELKPIQKFNDKLDEYKKVFGLENWKIDTYFIGTEDHNATTLADPRYYRAEMYIFKSVINNEKEWDMVIVHELIHIVMALYDFYADNLGKEGSQELFYIAREHSVSQLAHIIMRLLKNK